MAGPPPKVQLTRRAAAPLTMRDIGRERQREIYLQGISRAPVVPTDAGVLEARARAAMSAEAFAYVAGGAGLERTMAANRAAFDRWRVVPRMLRDVSTRELDVELFGARLPAPVMLAPIGVLEMAHREADLAVARAAARLRVPFVFSNQASVAMEVCAAAMGDAPRWFQLYWSKDDALVESFVRRAEACGCGAIVLTLDTTMLGWRPRDLDLGYLPFLRGKGMAQYTSDPVFRASLDTPPPDPRRPTPPRLTIRALLALFQLARSGASRAAVQRFVATYSRPSLTWKDLAWLRQRTKLPLLLKGILAAEDARRAVEADVDGVIVSNHGGRQVDGAVGALDALPDVCEAIDGRIPVLCDSGIRTGADILKALALGARAVLLGRPYVYGLAIAGEAGVRDVVRNLVAEFDLTMGLAGCRSVAEITRDLLVRDEA